LVLAPKEQPIPPLSAFETGQVLLINKPLKWSSFDVVKKLRNVIGVKKIGHAGTLDPLATGLLILCTGKFTKKIDEYQGMEKEYTGTFRLGVTTPSFDLETPVNEEFETKHLTKELIRQAALGFTGKITQVPPVYSAKKIEGKRAYELARKGKTAEVKPVEVMISSFEITGISMPEVSFRVVCSKGTYIRSLANDFGKALGSGAFLSSLCRTRIGIFRIEEAWDLDEFIESFASSGKNLPRVSE
jgi:tRNA pseudouridine55 synthase